MTDIEIEENLNKIPKYLFLAHSNHLLFDKALTEKQLKYSSSVAS